MSAAKVKMVWTKLAGDSDMKLERNLKNWKPRSNGIKQKMTVIEIEVY